jgi:hypothetical protein
MSKGLIAEIFDAAKRRTLTNERRRELAKEGKFYTADGTKYKKRYREQLSENNYYIDKYGYKRFQDSDILVHRWVAEKYILKRKLLPGEEVHHKNRNKLDNRINNLQVVTHGQHKTKHFVSKLLTGKK